MKNIYIYENSRVLDLEPIILTRPVFELRTGLFTNFTRIEKNFKDSKIALFVRSEIAGITKEHYSESAVNPPTIEEGLWLDGSVIWDLDSLTKIKAAPYAFYYNNGDLVAAKLPKETGQHWLQLGGPGADDMVACFPTHDIDVTVIRYLWDAVASIDRGIAIDLRNSELEKSNHKFSGVHLINEDQIYIDRTVNLMPGVVLDAQAGPIVLANDVQINSFSFIKGPIVIGPNSIISSHSSIRKCIIGSTCKIGGEVKDSIFQGWSNKVHAGHLGNAYIGAWVNIGAGTNNSNLKNTYEPVRVKIHDKLIDTKELQVGSFIGDYSTFAIGTRINTGAVIGPCSSVISTHFTPNIIPPFHWFIRNKLRKTGFKKFIKTAETMKQRRDKSLSEVEKELLKSINSRF